MYTLTICTQSFDSMSIIIEPFSIIWDNSNYFSGIAKKLVNVLRGFTSSTITFNPLSIYNPLENYSLQERISRMIANSHNYNVCNFHSNLSSDLHSLRTSSQNIYWRIFMYILSLVGHKAFFFAWLGLIFLLYYILYPYFAVTTNIIGRSLSVRPLLALLALFGNIIFILSGLLYDFLSIRFRVRNYIILNNFYITKLILGFLYLLYILAGVIACNGVYFLINENNSLYEKHKILLMLMSFVGTCISSSIWFWLRTPSLDPDFDILNSVFRSIFEAISFNMISYGTYISWNLWSSLPSYILLGLAIGTPLHILVSLIAIWLETFSYRFILYGPLYLTSFILINLATNSVFEIIYHASNYVTLYHAIIISASGVMVTILAPNVYRNTSTPVTQIQLHNLRRRNIILPNSVHESNRNRALYVLRSTIGYYALVLCFVAYSGIIWSYIL